MDGMLLSASPYLVGEPCPWKGTTDIQPSPFSLNSGNALIHMPQQVGSEVILNPIEFKILLLNPVKMPFLIYLSLYIFFTEYLEISYTN